MSEANNLVNVVFDVTGYPGESAAAHFSVSVKNEEVTLGDVSVAFGTGAPFDSAGGASIMHPGKSITGTAGVDLDAFSGRKAKAILSGTVDNQQFFFEKDVPMGPPMADVEDAGRDDSEE